MSFHYHTIVDEHATADAAEGLAASVLQWLVMNEIVSPERTDCVFSPSGGYPPGAGFVKAIEPLLPRNDDSFLGCKANGLQVITGRTVFHPGEAPIELMCDKCGRQFEAPTAWADAVGEWYEESGPAQLRCPYCDRTSAVTAWKHVPAWGFGFLGFRFVNWPPLSGAFIDAVSAQLHHPVVVVSGLM